MATLAVGVTVRFCMVMYLDGELRLVDGISIAQWSFVSIGGLHTVLYMLPIAFIQLFLHSASILQLGFLDIIQ